MAEIAWRRAKAPHAAADVLKALQLRMRCKIAARSHMVHGVLGLMSVHAVEGANCSVNIKIMGTAVAETLLCTPSHQPPGRGLIGDTGAR